MDGEGKFDRKLSLSCPSPGSNSSGGRDTTWGDTPDFTDYVTSYCWSGSGRAGRSRSVRNVRVGGFRSRVGEKVAI